MLHNLTGDLGRPLLRFFDKGDFGNPLLVVFFFFLFKFLIYFSLVLIVDALCV
jgi:hypothetical protein